MITDTVAQTPGTCHCGSPMRGSDHCPACGCEEYEATCDLVFVPPPAVSDLVAEGSVRDGMLADEVAEAGGCAVCAATYGRHGSFLTCPDHGHVMVYAADQDGCDWETRHVCPEPGCTRQAYTD